MLGYNATIRELDRLIKTNYYEDTLTLLESCNGVLEDSVLTEAEYNKTVEHLHLEIVDVDRFVKVNECQEVTNPVFYVRDNIPSDDGLLSNKIFGITKDDRAGIFGYIALNDYFLDPSCYKTWIRMDSHIKDVIHGLDTYNVNDKGEIVQDPAGDNGIKFLKKNIDKIKFKSTESVKRDLKIQYLEKNKNRMFINKYLVIPPFYRDTNTGKGKVGVGGVNVLYRDLLLAIRGLSTTQDYGFDQSAALTARAQELLLQIYDWFAGNNNPALKVDTGMGISGKKGVMKFASLGKTTNYSSRMVIVSPELKTESVDDHMVNMDHSAMPLAACLANYRPYMIFACKRFFENEFVGNEHYPAARGRGDIIIDDYITLKDPLIEFSDERIKREMDRFLHGYNNRLVPIQLPTDEGTYYMEFKGKWKQETNSESESIFKRRLTWCDVFYQAACEVVKDKNIIITRYPIDSYFNQITTKVVVSSTKETEPMYVNGIYYPYYPKFREEDIGTDTSNMFVDTFRMSNLYLKGMGGDYDGDTVTVKSPYTIEANEELAEFANSKGNFIDLGGNNVRAVSADCLQSIYSLTKSLDNGKKLTDPVFK